VQLVAIRAGADDLSVSDGARRRVGVSFGLFGDRVRVRLRAALRRGWHLAVWAMEFVRSDPLETELRQRIARALQAVTGITSAEEQDRELWRLMRNLL